MEARFAHDFSHVRVHTGPRAAESARAVDALAYTVGPDVVFAEQQYAPRTAKAPLRGDENAFETSDLAAGDSQRLFLLAHELAHIVQQQGADRDFAADVAVAPNNSPSEQQADEAAAAFLTHPARVSVGVTGRQLARRGPLPPPTPIRPPVRAPARPPGRTEAPSRQAPGTGSSEGAVYVPDVADDSFEAALQRAAIKDYAERERLRAERPVATLERGGRPPTFITVAGTRQHSYWGGPSGMNHTITVSVRKFHVLDAIEHAVGQAKDEGDLQAVADEYLPLTGLVNEAISLSRGRGNFTQGRVRSPVWRIWWDEPLYVAGFDPRAEQRLRVFETALRARAAQVPSLAQSRLMPESRRRGGCRIEPIASLGDDPMSVLYCHIATGSPHSYKITIETASGAATQRWAEIDSLRGNAWYECKCGYEALLSGAARGDGVARGVLDKLSKQVLNHVEIARTCGLEYRYIVSSERVAERLRNEWFGNVVIDVVPFEGCG